MPRYYFHIDDDRTHIDQVGVELPDLKAARDEAVSAAGQITAQRRRKRSLERETLAHVGYAVAVRKRNAAFRPSVFCDGRMMVLRSLFLMRTGAVN
jgi:hypothetical protein